MIEFELKEEYIELFRLLKYLRLSETGGHAKIMVDEGMVVRNGETEYRRRAKIRKGDILEVEGKKIIIRGL
jgi:ribosome-associated protein